MSKEIEAKFLDIDLEQIREKLKQNNAKLIQPMTLMRRYVYKNQDLKNKNAWLRIRDEGFRKTITYKQLDEQSIDGMQEFEIEINDINQAVKIVENLGFTNPSYQESKREIWQIKDIEIMIDQWPWTNHFMEIEADNSEKVYSIANLLGFDEKDAKYGDVFTVYRHQYPKLGPDGKLDLQIVKFDDPLPKELQ